MEEAGAGVPNLYIYRTHIYIHYIDIYIRLSVTHLDVDEVEEAGAGVPCLIENSAEGA
jgi:hypothetical protein